MSYRILAAVAGTFGRQVKIKEFDQRVYMAQLPWDKGVENGVCRVAPASTYLWRNLTRAIDKSEDTTGDEFDDVFAVEAGGTYKFFTAFRGVPSPFKSDVSKWDEIRGVHKRFAKIGPVSEYDVIEAAKNTVGEVSRKTLQYSGYICANTAGAGITAQVLPAEKGYWLISTGGHAMAAVIRVQKHGMKLKFFDPSSGQAVFTDVILFRDFLNKYLIECGYLQGFFIRFRS